MFHPDEEESHLATPAEAVREWAWNVGYLPDYINRQWLNHDFDVWTLNPHYTGPPQRHPEDYDPDEDEGTQPFKPVYPGEEP